MNASAPADDKNSKPQNEATEFTGEYDWQQVSEEESDETKVVFDTIGDEFVGVYLGKREVPNEDGTFWQHRFAVGEQKFFVNGNHSLNQGMSRVAKGAVARVEYTSDKDTGAASPMRVYTVYVAKKKTARAR